MRSMGEHADAETGLRHANLALEADVKALVDKYDREMFQRHRTLDKIRAEYAEEKAELAKLLVRFEAVDEQRKAIVAENLAEEQRRREAILEQHRMKKEMERLQEQVGNVLFTTIVAWSEVHFQPFLEIFVFQTAPPIFRVACLSP